MKPATALSDEERRRAQVLKSLLDGDIDRQAALERLGVHRDTLWRWIRRYENEGEEGLAHGLRGRPSNRRTDESVRAKVIELYRAAASTERPTPKQFWRELNGVFSKAIPYKTVYRWLCESGLHTPGVLRRRGECGVGHTVEIEAVSVDWFSPHGAFLMCAVDRSSRLVLSLELGERHGNPLFLRCLAFTLEHHGIPIAVRIANHAAGSSHSGDKLNPLALTKCLAHLGVDASFHSWPRKRGLTRAPSRGWLDWLGREVRSKGETLGQAKTLIRTLVEPLNGFLGVEPSSDDECFVPIGNRDARTLLWEEVCSIIDRQHQVSSSLFNASVESDDYRTSYVRTHVSLTRALDGRLSVRYQGRELRFTHTQKEASL